MSRLPTRLLVTGLLRRVQQAGGFATVLSHGSDSGGAILVQCLENGRFTGFFERMLDFDGNARLVSCGPAEGASAAELTDYIDRRRSRDPDLWIIELDTADAHRFADETIGSG